jgi:outer membrane biosynthesis protein TonB
VTIFFLFAILVGLACPTVAQEPTSTATVRSAKEAASTPFRSSPSPTAPLNGVSARHGVQKINNQALSVYQKQLDNDVGKRWYSYVDRQRDSIAVGTVRITFDITFEGKLTNLKIASNSSNQLFADLCSRVVKETHFRPLPRSALAYLKQNGTTLLEEEMKFTMYEK